MTKLLPKELVHVTELMDQAKLDKALEIVENFEKNGLIRHCGKDISINMNSEDIIIKIYDKSGEFIGILNVATPCDVVLVKPPNFYGDSN